MHEVVRKNLVSTAEHCRNGHGSSEGRGMKKSSVYRGCITTRDAFPRSSTISRKVGNQLSLRFDTRTVLYDERPLSTRDSYTVPAYAMWLFNGNKNEYKNLKERRKKVALHFIRGQTSWIKTKKHKIRTNRTNYVERTETSRATAYRHELKDPVIDYQVLPNFELEHD